MKFLRRPLALLPILLGTAACLAPAGDVSSDGQDITNSPQSSVKDQLGTVNCWLFTVNAWAESLGAPEDATTNDVASYATSWLVYWNFYEQITAAPDTIDAVIWTGGWWGEAAELVQRYGLVKLSLLTTSKAEDADARLSIQGRKAMTESLKTGALRTKASRKNRKLIRRELDKAFGLSAEQAKILDSVFGEDGTKTFDKGARSASRFVRAPSDLRARLPRQDREPARYVTLNDVIGKRAGAGTSSEIRAGEYAWSWGEFRDWKATRAPERSRAMRAYLKRIQKALHAGVPVPISWCAEDAGVDASGAFQVPLSGIQEGNCGHESLAVDYEVVLPNGKVLKAGVPASLEDQAAALDDGAVIKFLRVKNTWGSKDKRTTNGYTDISLDYLMSKLRACPDKKESDQCVEWQFLLQGAWLPPGF